MSAPRSSPRQLLSRSLLRTTCIPRLASPLPMVPVLAATTSTATLRPRPRRTRTRMSVPRSWPRQGHKAGTI
ncbi:hypothetical protein ACHAWF_001504 [Thalassiosira exigua]